MSFLFFKRIDANAENQKEYSEIIAAMQKKVKRGKITMINILYFSLLNIGSIFMSWSKNWGFKEVHLLEIHLFFLFPVILDSSETPQQQT